jgi:SAM-dependent methyltransferase
MAERQRDYWDGESDLPLDASVIDRNDSRGAKNRYLAGLRDRSIVSALGSLKSNAPLLDFGCGNGSLTRALVADGHHVLGIDISAGLLARTRERNLGDASLFVMFDGVHLPLADSSVAAITTYLVLNHIIDDSHLEAVILELRRVLKPGGIVVAIEQVRAQAYMDASSWKHQRTIPQLCELFVRAGFPMCKTEIIRYGRFPTTPLVRFGLLPSWSFQLLEKMERTVGRIYGVPHCDYCDVRFIVK